jgi:hypothetical protein
MAAEESLSGQQFYHGTTADLPDETVLRPGAVIGKRNFGDARGATNDHVFMASTPDSAYLWASQGAGRKKNVHVYQVDPAHDVHEHGGEGDFAASSAVIRSKLFTSKKKH